MADWIGKNCIINGRLKPIEDIPRHHSPDEKSVYEVLRVENKVPLFIEDHFSRLKNSFSLCNRHFPMSLTDFRKIVRRLVDENELSEGPVKFIFPDDDNKQGFIAYFMIPHRPTTEEYRSGIKTVTLYEERNNPNAKIWNSQLRETAAKLINKNEAYEAILIDKDNYITEGSRSNVFFIKNDTVFTTPDDRILPGITRKKVLEICFDKGIETKLTLIPYNKINEFDSVFLTGTSRKVVPVKSIDNYSFDTDNKLMRDIMKYFDNLVAGYITKHKKL
jgi:branched-chain amino acid aminotransferase